MKKPLLRWAVPAIAGLLTVGVANAHHSFSAVFDAKKPVRLVGTLTRIEWTNPHSAFTLDVKGRDGTVTTWVAEGANPGALSRRGLKRGVIKIGDTLTVDGYLAKAGGRIIDARRVTLPDGRVISGATPGDGGPQDATAAQASTAAP
jgi:hypothetical protein